MNQSFSPGAVWRDTDGVSIQAHGGGVLFYEGVYYWFGENKDGETSPGQNNWVEAIGVSCYASRDLYNWENKGVVLRAVPGHPDLDPGGVIERPKVVYNATTGTFVMWLHLDDTAYQSARTGVAVAKKPAGPYTFIKSLEPAGQDSRDMTVFKDGAEAYFVFSSDWNKTLKIAPLTDDYLDVSTPLSRHFVEQSREAPALFKHEKAYFLLSSGCTGWEPNEAQYAVANTVQGNWEVRGNPCVGLGAETTFDSQITFALPVAGKTGAFIIMMDRWNKDDLGDSRYVWLPAQLEQDNLSVAWLDEWDLSVFD